MIKKIKVKPIHETLTSTGTMWEYILMQKGWNELPDRDKYGYITNMYEGGLVDVYFPGLDFTCGNIFTDEICLFK